MGRRGPKPRPKALRLLRHAGPTPRQPATVATADPPAMPANLSADEQACWTGVLAEMSSVPGLLARCDRGVLELVARLEPAMRAAAEIVRAKGSTIECLDADGRVKFIQQRTEAVFLLKAAAFLKGAYAELGLTPSGRTRVQLSPAAPASKLERFLQHEHGA